METKVKKKPLYKRWWFIVLVILIVLGIIASTGKKKEGTDEKTASEEAASEAAVPDTSGKEQTNSQNQESSEVSAESSNAAEKEESSAALSDLKNTKFHVGDVIETKGLKIVYVASGVYEDYGAYSEPKEGYQYIYIDLYFENTGKTDVSVSMFSFEGYADGYSVEQYFGTDEDFSSTLSPGRYTVGKACFTVPVDAQEIEIEYEINFITEEKAVFVYEGEKGSGFVAQVNTQTTEGAYQVGDTVDLKNLKITFVECGEWESDNQFIQPAEGNKYIYMLFEVENTGSSNQSITFYSFDCYADGKDCSGVYSRDDALSATLSAGRKASGTVAFEVPVDASVIEIEYLDNVFTSSRVVFSYQEP